MNNGPELWNRLLNEAPKGSIIMGGAVIDYAMGHDAKDIDVFYKYVPGMPQGLPDTWVYEEQDWNDPAVVEAHNAEYNNKTIGAVYQYKVEDVDIPVQMIGVMYDDPRKHFKSFDHTLTLGMYTKKGMFLHRKVFDSIRTKIVTCLTKTDKAKALARATRKIKRYGKLMEWSFVGFE